MENFLSIFSGGCTPMLEADLAREIYGILTNKPDILFWGS